MEGGLTVGDISAGMLGWFTIWSTPWFMLVIIQFFYVSCRQDALCSCFRNAVTARDQGQRFAVACFGVGESSTYHVGGGKDPCIFFLKITGNIFHLHIHVICLSQWLCGLRRGSASTYFLEGLWVRITSGNECLSLVSVVCCQVEVSGGVYRIYCVWVRFQNLNSEEV